MIMLHLFASLAIAAAALTATAAHAQDLSKFPDWSGQWKKPAGVGNNFDFGKPAGRGQQAPLTPEYQAIFNTNSADRAEGGLGGDHSGLCLPHGIRGMMIADYRIELGDTPARG